MLPRGRGRRAGGCHRLSAAARFPARGPPGARSRGPIIHSCGARRRRAAGQLGQPTPGFYVAGTKSYGRAPTFLMLTGYEQVRSIVAEIAGDHEAAAKAELVLPETGGCSGPGPLAA